MGDVRAACNRFIDDPISPWCSMTECDTPENEVVKIRCLLKLTTGNTAAIDCEYFHSNVLAFTFKTSAIKPIPLIWRTLNWLIQYTSRLDDNLIENKSKILTFFMREFFFVGAETMNGGVQFSFGVHLLMSQFACEYKTEGIKLKAQRELINCSSVYYPS